MNRLKKELEQLKRENRRLRKQLRLQDGAGSEPFDDESAAEEAETKPARKPRKKGDLCAKCKEPAEIKELGPYTYKWCTDTKCNHRQKLK